MEILEDWLFNEKRIITSNLLAALSKLSFDEASNLLYDFYKTHKSKVSVYYLAFLKAKQENRVFIERMSEDEMLACLGNQAFREKIVSLKIWALYDKSKGNINKEDIFNAESYEAQNKDSRNHKLRTLEPEQSIPLGTQHVIKKSQALQGPFDTQSQIEKKSFFRRQSSTQSDDASPVKSPPKTTFKEIAANLNQETKRRKLVDVNMTLEINPTTKKSKKTPTIIEIEDDGEDDCAIIPEPQF